MAVSPESDRTSVLVRFGGTLSPAKGQDFLLTVLGHPLISRSYRLGGGTCTQGEQAQQGSAPPLVFPLPSSRLSSDSPLYPPVPTPAHPVSWTYFLCYMEESGTPSLAICDKI